MAQSGKSVFNNPLLSTKVKSANVKIVPEALLGYLVGPFSAACLQTACSAPSSWRISRMFCLPKSWLQATQAFRPF